jgi:glycosyltransferase involved in cell wall biosynthesis
MVILANSFADRGYEVDLVLAKAEGPYLKEVADAVRVVDLKSMRVLTSLPGLVRYLRRLRPLALLSALGQANVVAIVAKFLARIPTRLVVSEHANFSMSMKHKKLLRTGLVGWLMRLTYRRADGVIAVSGGVADDLAAGIALPRSSIDVVYNPVETLSLHELANEEVNDPWFQAGEPPVVLGVGRLESAKGFADLIRAFGRLRNTHHARLMVLGEGSLRLELEGLVRRLGLENEVRLPGFVDNPFSFMRRASVFALSSGWEGFGNALIEAMACGTPVVSTACAGPDEILDSGKWGRLVPVGDVDALAAAMAAALDENEHPDVASRAGEFSIDRAVEGYLEVMLPAPKERQS